MITSDEAKINRYHAEVSQRWGERLGSVFSFPLSVVLAAGESAAAYLLVESWMKAEDSVR